MSDLKEKIISEIKKIYDPEIPVNIFELGLIYKIEVNEDKKVFIEMTLTSPNCPAAETLPAEVEQKVGGMELVKSCKVNIVFEPTWDRHMMSEEAQIELGMI